MGVRISERRQKTGRLEIGDKNKENEEDQTPGVRTRAGGGAREQEKQGKSRRSKRAGGARQ